MIYRITSFSGSADGMLIPALTPSRTVACNAMFKIVSRLFLAITFLMSLSVAGQSVLIRGRVLHEWQNPSTVVISVNDTLRKISGRSPFDWKTYDEIMKDGKFRTSPSSNGEFSIRVNPTDSLYFISFRHLTQRFSVLDLQKMSEIEIKLIKEPCEMYVPCLETDKRMTIFIGRKLSRKYVEEKYYCNAQTSDAKFEAKYEIIRMLQGDELGDSISFMGYEHFPTFAFDRDTVMLFVTNHCGQMIQEKYAYFNIAKTKKGEWALPYQPMKDLFTDSLFKALIIPTNFEGRVAYRTESTSSRKSLYLPESKQFYKKQRNIYIPKFGIPLTSLIDLSKQTLFRGRVHLFN